MRKIENLEYLQKLYGEPSQSSLIKEVAQIIPPYRKFIEASPFCTLATMGDKRDVGMMDCSPRGDVPGFVKVNDPRTLLIPDRRGNNRIDTLRNIIADPRIAVCFMIPGSNNCLRVNGEAFVTDDEDVLTNFAVDTKKPRSAIVIKAKSIYFQCGRAIIRSKLWDSASAVDPKTLPSAGEVLSYVSKNEIDGDNYDQAWEARANTTLW